MRKMLLGGDSVVVQIVLRHAERHLVYAALFSALLNLLHLAPTLYMLTVYDRVLPTQGGMTLLLVTLVLLFALASLAGLDWIRSRLLVRLSARLERVLAGEILASVLGEAEIPQIKRNQAVRDFDTFRQGLAGSALIALLDAPWAPVFLCAAFLLHPALGLITLAATVTLGALAYLNEKATAPSLRRASEAAAHAYAKQDYTAASAETVRALGMVRALTARHLEERARMVALQTRASFVGGALLGLTKFLRLALQSVALGVGAWLAIRGEISAGAVIAASFLMTRALAPVEQLVAGWRSIVQARGARDRLDELLLAGADAPRRTRLPVPRGALRLERVTAAPSAADQPSIIDVSLAAGPGEVLAVVGPSGAGKSTLMRMAAGAAPPLQGVVRLDGAAMRDWPSETLARAVGYLPQDFVLFPGSIKDNISRFARYEGVGDEDVDAQAVAAAQSAGAHEMIVRLPQGYETEIGANGAGLSAGQRQRIALARAFYGAPALLVLDEPNAHLDAEGESALANAVANAKARGATVIMAIHHGLMLRLADNVALLQDGRLQGLGPLDQMLRAAPAPASPAAQAGARPPPSAPAPAPAGAAGSAPPSTPRHGAVFPVPKEPVGSPGLQVPERSSGSDLRGAPVQPAAGGVGGYSAPRPGWAQATTPGDERLTA